MITSAANRPGSRNPLAEANVSNDTFSCSSSSVIMMKPFSSTASQHVKVLRLKASFSSLRVHFQKSSCVRKTTNLKTNPFENKKKWTLLVLRFSQSLNLKRIWRYFVFWLSEESMYERNNKGNIKHGRKEAISSRAEWEHIPAQNIKFSMRVWEFYQIKAVWRQPRQQMMARWLCSKWTL